jgi:hypothetical protein
MAAWGCLRSGKSAWGELDSVSVPHPRCLRLLDVRPGVGGHTPPAADAGSAVISDNQPQSLERFKFLQDGTVTRAVSSVSRQVYAPSIPVPAPFGDDRQQSDLTIGKRSVTHGASPGWKR